MFDKYMIGETGFRNVTEVGRVTGFQIEVRITYYRGLGLSMVEGFDVTVDGVAYPREKNLFTVRGRTLTFAEMQTEYEERWEMGEFATLTVPCEGGLTAGSHEVKVSQVLRVSYLPWLSITTFGRSLMLEEI